MTELNENLEGAPDDTPTETEKPLISRRRVVKVGVAVTGGVAAAAYLKPTMNALGISSASAQTVSPVVGGEGGGGDDDPDNPIKVCHWDCGKNEWNFVGAGNHLANHVCDKPAPPGATKKADCAAAYPTQSCADCPK